MVFTCEISASGHDPPEAEFGARSALLTRADQNVGKEQARHCELSRNTESVRRLLDARRRELVEASLRNSTWVMGIAADFAKMHGTNRGGSLLGKALTGLRNRLTAECGARDVPFAGSRKHVHRITEVVRTCLTMPQAHAAPLVSI